jgi:chemotaxis protein MotB
MAGKGGGAWKVAYADFVTAMMAFFLVMWICSQDQKFRQAVARYFNNPSNIGSIGSSKVPNRAGSLFDSPNGGDLPGGEAVAMGQGRFPHSAPGEPSPPTKLMSDWLHHDKKVSDYWQDQAERARQKAAMNPRAKNKREQTEEAALKLARQMREDIVQGIPADTKGVYRDLLFRAIAEVNWLELAEDLMPAE